MKLTTKSEYSLLALVFIARHQKKGYVRLAAICEKYAIPKKYLEQILYMLKGSRYTMTKRGLSGGYRLSKPASKITIAEIVRLMDGALAPTESASHYFFAHTPIEQEKKILKVMKRIRDYIARELEHLTLADFI